MTPGPMDNLSKEERRARALEMLKAKPPAAKASQAASPEEAGEGSPKRSPAAEKRPRRPRRPAKAPAPQTRTAPEADETVPISPSEPTKPVAVPRVKQSKKHAKDLLVVEGVDVHYGKIQALRGIDLRIAQGDVVALLGANGAGKSSTLRAISGMISPTAGTITFDGEVISGLPAFDVVKHGISHVPEGRELFPTLQVEENLRLGYWPQRKAEAGSLKDALDRVYTMFPRLKERRVQAAGTMSGGEQQMLAFGRALMCNPRLLLVDEMSLGLAPLIVQILFDAVEHINGEGASVILVEQFVHKALRHAERAYVLAKGEVVLDAKSEKLRNDPNLLAAYLGGAEGGVEEVAETAKPAKKAPSKKSASGGSRSSKAKSGKA